MALRPWRAEDAPAVVAAIDGDPEIARWLDQVPQPYGLQDAHAYVAACRRGWAEGTAATFAVVDAIDRRLVGSLSLRLADLPAGVAEAGYWVAREARGRGVTTRALVLVSRWALSLDGVARLQLRADVQNSPSRRVAEKAGYTLEGVLRSAAWSKRQQRRYDWAMYSLLPEDLD